MRRQSARWQIPKLKPPPFVTDNMAAAVGSLPSTDVSSQSILPPSLRALLLSQAEQIDKAISRHRVDVAHDSVCATHRAQRIAKLIQQSIDSLAGQFPQRAPVREVGEECLESSNMVS
jgi:hypothetical protein